MSHNPPIYRYNPRVDCLSFLDDVIEESVKPQYIGQVYTIDYLTEKMNWGLSRIDEELRKGNIVQVGKGGKVGFRFTCELGQTGAQNNRSRYARPMVNSRIGVQLKHGLRK